LLVAVVVPLLLAPTVWCGGTAAEIDFAAQAADC
jgi:hypothetical protein